MLRGKDRLMEVLQRIGLRYKIILDLRSGFLIKFIPSSLMIVVIRCNPKPNNGKGTSSPTEKPTCGNCGKKQYGDCLKGTDNCSDCAKSGHKVRDFPNERSQDKGSDQAQKSDSNEAPRKKRFYSLRSRGEEETYLDVVTSVLKVFSIYVYDLIDRSANLSFFTPLVAKKFDILPDILHEPFILSSPVGE